MRVQRECIGGPKMSCGSFLSLRGCRPCVSWFAVILAVSIVSSAHAAIPTQRMRVPIGEYWITGGGGPGNSGGGGGGAGGNASGKFTNNSPPISGGRGGGGSGRISLPSIASAGDAGRNGAGGDGAGGDGAGVNGGDAGPAFALPAFCIDEGRHPPGANTLNIPRKW
jgi:hypothetical protein